MIIIYLFIFFKNKLFNTNQIYFIFYPHVVPGSSILLLKVIRAFLGNVAWVTRAHPSFTSIVLRKAKRLLNDSHEMSKIIISSCLD